MLAAGLLACRFCTPFKLYKAALPAAELPVCRCRPLPAVPGPGSADGKSSRERARAPRFPSHPRAAASAGQQPATACGSAEPEPSFHGRGQQALLQPQAPQRLLSSHFPSQGVAQAQPQPHSQKCSSCALHILFLPTILPRMEAAAAEGSQCFSCREGCVLLPRVPWAAARQPLPKLSLPLGRFAVGMAPLNPLIPAVIPVMCCFPSHLCIPNFSSQGPSLSMSHRGGSLQWHRTYGTEADTETLKPAETTLPSCQSIAPHLDKFLPGFH